MVKCLLLAQHARPESLGRPLPEDQARPHFTLGAQQLPVRSKLLWGLGHRELLLLLRAPYRHSSWSQSAIPAVPLLTGQTFKSMLQGLFREVTDSMLLILQINIPLFRQEVLLALSLMGPTTQVSTMLLLLGLPPLQTPTVITLPSLSTVATLTSPLLNHHEILRS